MKMTNSSSGTAVVGNRIASQILTVSSMIVAALAFTTLLGSTGRSKADHGVWESSEVSGVFGTGHSTDFIRPSPDVRGSDSLNAANASLGEQTPGGALKPYTYDSGGVDGCCNSYCIAAPEEESCFRLTELNQYTTASYLDNLSGTFVELEFVTQLDIGPFVMENRTDLNVADLPGTIALGPTNPFGASGPSVGVRAAGFGDILSGFFFSPKDHNAHYHLSIGPVFTFPTASDDILGSSQYTVGPGAHFSTEINKLTAGFFIWQSWEVSGFESGGKRVDQLFGKPFFIYELTEDWNLIYIPLGLSYSWKSKGGENFTFPLGGGIRKLFDCGDHQVGLQAQAFQYVSRKPKDPKWELRFTVEILFDQ